MILTLTPTLHLYFPIDSSVVRFIFLFSTLHKNYENIVIRTNTGIKFRPVLIDNTDFRFVKSISFDLPVAKTLNSTIIYTDCHLTNTCLNQAWALKDTATFNDKSPSSLAYMQGR